MLGIMQTRYKKRALKPPRGCIIAGCTRKHAGHGLCMLHYTRKRYKGDPEKMLVGRSGRCLIVGCEVGPRYRKGLCDKHRKERDRLACPPCVGVTAKGELCPRRVRVKGETCCGMHGGLSYSKAKQC